MSAPIRRLLIANRGEIAVRIIRSCRSLGVQTVLVASTADRDALPARLADRVLCIGPPRPTESYLRVETIVQAALGSGAQAVHPGYGFLSERPALARLCEENGIVFVGPTATQLEATGDKLRAREAAIAADVPVVPGGEVREPADAQRILERIGLPLLVKAVGGGGGKGMKLVREAGELAGALELAAGEAAAAFGDARIYIERYVERGRHVEVQVLGDGRGAVVHLGERDCSVQRRYQKLLEETPAPQLADELRRQIHAAAVRFAARLHYRGAGTVEFLVDCDRQTFYFLEMNARIQVEHPVTEAVTGIDLVAEQLAIAGGETLSPAVQAAVPHGAALECRINAEDPARDFQPSPGTVTAVHWPQGAQVRVDTHIEAGSRIPPFYDSLMAKIIVHGPDRAAALAAMRTAIAATRIEGVASNLALHARILEDPEFIRGGMDTGFLARHLAQQGP